MSRTTNNIRITCNERSIYGNGKASEEKSNNSGGGDGGGDTIPDLSTTNIIAIDAKGINFWNQNNILQIANFNDNGGAYFYHPMIVTGDINATQFHTSNGVNYNNQSTVFKSFRTGFTDYVLSTVIQTSGFALVHDFNLAGFLEVRTMTNTGAPDTTRCRFHQLASIAMEIPSPLILKVTNVDTMNNFIPLTIGSQSDGVNIGRTGYISNFLGTLQANDIDTDGKSMLNLGMTNTLQVNIARTGILTEVLGPLTSFDIVTAPHFRVGAAWSFSGTYPAYSSVNPGTSDIAIATLVTGIGTPNQRGYCLVNEASFGGLSFIAHNDNGTFKNRMITFYNTGKVRMQVLTENFEVNLIDTPSNATGITIGGTNANKLNLSHAGVTTEVFGPLQTDVSVSYGANYSANARITNFSSRETVLATSYVLSTLCTGAGTPDQRGYMWVNDPVNTSIVIKSCNDTGTVVNDVLRLYHNGNVTMPTIDTTFRASRFDTLISQTMLIGYGNASQVNIAAAGVLTIVEGFLESLDTFTTPRVRTIDIDSYDGKSSLAIGTVNATALTVGRTATTMTINSTTVTVNSQLNANQTVSVGQVLIAPHPIGEVYAPATATDMTNITGLGIINTWIKANIGTEGSGDTTSNVQFTVNNSGRLTYTGTRKLTVRVFAAISYTDSTTRGLWWCITRSNNPIVSSIIRTNSGGLDTNLNLQCTQNMATNDWVEVWIQAKTGITNVTVTHFNLQVISTFNPSPP